MFMFVFVCVLHPFTHYYLVISRCLCHITLKPAVTLLLLIIYLECLTNLISKEIDSKSLLRIGQSGLVLYLVTYISLHVIYDSS